MKQILKGIGWAAGLALVVFVVGAAGRPLQATTQEAQLGARVDKVFERWNKKESPGCAISVGEQGRLLLARAYGMADLEDEIAITPETIFEAGSVSKQFTAFAVMLLVGEGRLSLDDPVRKHIPELPAFGEGIRVRHLLSHVSGLRSQWPLLTLAGRPPTLAVHTIPEILDLVSRQTRANFQPGEEYLYNNTAFTLLSVIVSRVSGQPFQEFCDARIFKPIGMTRTRWRTDHTAVVKGRATAYSLERDGAFHTQMSFTDVVGNGGLLTTVGDLFKWNENLDSAAVGGRALVNELQTRTRLNDGTEIEYGKGLSVGEYRGLREVNHGGSTAGYRAQLTRFPDQRVSIAVLCNSGSIAPDGLAHQVADAVLEGRFKDVAPAAAITVSESDLTAKVGLYRDVNTDAVLRLAVTGGKLRAGGAELVPIGPGRFRNTGGRTEYVFTPASAGNAASLEERGRWARAVTWTAVPQAAPSLAELQAYAGTYRSEELDVPYIVWVESDKLMIRHRPEPAVTLGPLYADAFDFGQGRVVRFTHDQSGRVDAFEVYAGRVRHLRFDKR